MRKTIPYANTKISPEDTKAEIEKLLKEHDIRDIQWTSYQGETTLKFIFKVKVRGVEREIMFSFKPPNISMKKRTYNRGTYRYDTVTMDNLPVSYRLLYWYLKTKLEAVQFGIETVEHEFMSHIMVALPDGQPTTLGEKLADVTEMLGLPSFADKKALTAESTRVVEAEFEKEG